MAQLLINDLEDAILQNLQQRASAHARTLEAEARSILTSALESEKQTAWDRINAFRESLAATGRTFSDSTELIREDRER